MAGTARKPVHDFARGDDDRHVPRRPSPSAVAFNPTHLITPSYSAYLCPCGFRNSGVSLLTLQECGM